MMKLRNSFLMRCLSLALALVLVVSNVTPGIALQASAAEYKKTAGEIMAENYGLSEAEKNLLASGYLAGSYTVEYDGVQDSWVAVDPDSKKITADEKNGWIAKTAEIVVNSETVETVTMTDGQGSYKYKENAFSVKVNYELSMNVENQQTMLAAMPALKAGVANLKTAYDASDASLGTVVLAMDVLKQLAAGINLGWASVQFGADAIAAVEALSAQMTANGGTLDMQDANAAYAGSNFKTEYLENNGASYAAIVADTYENLNAIKSDGLFNNSILDSYLQSQDPTNYSKWMTLKGVLGNLVSGLEAPASANWVTENLTNSSANYAQLDSLVAELGGTSEVTVKNPLKVAVASANFNMSMFNVAVEVKLEKVKDEVDCKELYLDDTKSDTITLEADATVDQIVAAIEAKGIEADALAAWGIDLEYFDRKETKLPDVLTEDITYKIEYTPKNYTISGVINDTVPYGYQLTLPAHEDETKAYDYKVTKNGVVEDKSQGTVYFVDADILVERASGKAYTTNTLMNIVGENFGNEKVQKILGSGALYNNPAVNVRYPDAGNLKLEGGNITAGDYASDYKGLMWVPYSYGAEGTENLFSGNTGAWAADQAKVIYRLNVGYSAEDAAQILAMVETLESEANAQKKTLDTLAGYEAQMGQLNSTLLGVLISTVESTGGVSETFITNLKIIKENHIEDKNLRIYNMVKAYKDEHNGGLTYYYLNSEAVRNEIKALSELMAGMVENPDDIVVLKGLVGEMGFADYADKLDNLTELEAAMANVQASLTAPNAAINLASESLPVLTAALEMSEKVSYNTPAAPYLQSVALNVVSSDKAMVEIFVQHVDKNDPDTVIKQASPVSSDALERGYVLTDADINSLMQQKNAAVAELFGDDAAYYVCAVSGDEVKAGTVVNTSLKVYYKFVEKNYTVKIDGCDDQYVTVSKLTVDLPAHTEPGFGYTYYIGTAEYEGGSTGYFTKEQLGTLFVNGVYTIEREEYRVEDVKTQKWIDVVNEALGKNAVVPETNEMGYITKVTINISDKDFMGFAMGIAKAGNDLYFNGNPFFVDGVLHLQTMIDAILADSKFTSQNIINLADNNGGYFFTANGKFGGNSDSEVATCMGIDEEDAQTGIPFEFNLTEVPAEMKLAGGALKSASGVVSFRADNGSLAFDLTLPEAIYNTYLTALVATDEVKMDAAKINNDIAMQFMYDYINEIVRNEKITTTTFHNTLVKLSVEDMLGDYDLREYESYYQMLTSFLNEGVQVNTNDDENAWNMHMSVEGKSTITKLFNLIGFNAEGLLSLIAETAEGETLDVNIIPNITNVDNNVNAMVINMNGGISNAIDYVDLSKHTGSVSGAVMLLNNASGNLTFSGTSILDLNGKTFTGNIHSNGTLFIVDSSLVTNSGAEVTGSISGNVTVLGGKYADLNGSFLKSGYHQVGGVVQNKLYTVTGSEVAPVFELNTDVIGEEISYTTFAQAVAIDVAVDIILNYYNAASLSVNGNSLYSLGVTADDLFAILGGANTGDFLINKILSSVNVPGMSGLVNDILDQLLNFAELEAKMADEQPIMTNTFTTAPWGLSVEYVEDGNYINFGIAANDAKRKSITTSLKFAGNNVKYIEDVVGELADVAQGTDINIDVKQPEYGNKLFNVEGSADVTIMLDLTKRDIYVDVLTIILANGNPANKTALVNALNAGDDAALKAEYDKLTVKNIADALKAVNKNDSLKSLADKAGIKFNVSTEKWGQMEDLFILMVSGAGKVLDELGLNGNNSKLGGLDKDGDGTYVLEKERDAETEKSVAGYGVNATAAAKVTISVKLFDEVSEPEEECLWGDIDHDGYVGAKDATLVLQYEIDLISDYTSFCFEKADVDGDGQIGAKDATLILQYEIDMINKFPVEE